MQYLAYRVHVAREAARLESCSLPELTEGEVRIRCRYAGINYKDALAMTGQGAILRSFPLTPGIDMAGEVVESRHPDWLPGQPVVSTGGGLGEERDGSFGQYLQLPAAQLVALPENLSLQQAAILGTPAVTAVLALGKLELNGLQPEQGPVVVTGASGGVGMMAVSLLAARGFEVVAVTAKTQQAPLLMRLGACQVLDSLPLTGKALASATWAAAIDTVGGPGLASILSQLRPDASAVSVGLAGGSQFDASVMPFILRGANLLGVSSSHCPNELRRCIWLHLATDLQLPQLDWIHQATIALAGVPDYCQQMLNRQTWGRTLVEL